MGKKKDLIKVGKDGKNSINKRIGGIATRCVWLKLPDDGEEFVDIEDGQIPFDFEQI